MAIIPLSTRIEERDFELLDQLVAKFGPPKRRFIEVGIELQARAGQTLKQWAGRTRCTSCILQLSFATQLKFSFLHNSFAGIELEPFCSCATRMVCNKPPNSMKAAQRKNGLTMVEREYLRLLRPQLREAIREGDQQGASAYAKELARLRQKQIRGKGKRSST